MKKLSRVTALAAVLAGVIAAQTPFGVMTASAPPDPATIVADQVKRLTSLLTLTTTQVTQATTIFTNAQTAVTPLETGITTNRTALQAAVKSNATSTIDQLSAAIGTAEGQIIAIQNKADAAFYAILTTAQQTILNSSGFDGGFDGGGPGGPGGHGGPGR